MAYPPYSSAPPAPPPQQPWPVPYPAPPYGYGQPRTPTNAILYLGAGLASLGGALVGIGWLLPDNTSWPTVVGIGYLLLGPGLGMALIGLGHHRGSP